ncbi:PaaI family thioesterase [Streptomyces sp. NPDC050448]|uniref:PaaI family thioesterase n=1 Tax=Streptomyces sp. NPDC050448 TaxID=3155404 RepID=UPI003420CBFC
MPLPATTARRLAEAPHEPGYTACFGCGSAMPAGLHVHVVDDDPEELVAMVRLNTAHQGAPGFAHSGVVATLLDEVISLALWRLLDRRCVTARLETAFHAPVPIGRDLELRARCTGVQGRKVYTRAQVLLGGTAHAEAAGLFIDVAENLAHSG